MGSCFSRSKYITVAQAHEGANAKIGLVELSRWQYFLSRDKTYHALRHTYMFASTSRLASTAGFGFAQSYLNSLVVIFAGLNPKNLPPFAKIMLSVLTGFTTVAYGAYVFKQSRHPAPSSLVETIATSPLSSVYLQTGSDEEGKIYDVLQLIKKCKNNQGWLKNVGTALTIKQWAALLHPVLDATFAAGTLADFIVFVDHNRLGVQPTIQLGCYAAFFGIGFVSYLSQEALVRSIRIRHPVVPNQRLKYYKGLPKSKVAKSRLIIPGILGAMGGLAMGLYWTMFVLNRAGIDSECALFKGFMWGVGALICLAYAAGAILSELNYQIQIDPVILDYRKLYHDLAVRDPSLLIGLPKCPPEGSLGYGERTLPNTREFWTKIIWGIASSIFEAMTMNNIYRATLPGDPLANPESKERIYLAVFILAAVVLGVWNQYNIEMRNNHVNVFKSAIDSLHDRLVKISEAPEEDRPEVVHEIVNQALLDVQANSVERTVELPSPRLPFHHRQTSSTSGLAVISPPVIEMISDVPLSQNARTANAVVLNIASPLASPNDYRALPEDENAYS
ncbi:MAG: hypothetical protein Q7V63_02030 [Gammaproteobacteria bacterium]|nr:hypothetical protein [Gammaproteobacteria bacterium]